MKKILQLLMLVLTSFGFAQDGSIDTSFNPLNGATSGDVNSVNVQPDGKILVGGSFFVLNNGPYNRLGRLNADGTLDETFNLGSGFNDAVFSTNIQPDGKIIVLGSFTTYNGMANNRIVRLNSNGTIDATFNVGIGANDNVKSAVIQADGKIIVIGNFTSFNGVAKSRIVRLNADGTTDATFLTTGANSPINSCVLQSDGKILLGGSFTLFGGTARNRIVRLNSDGTLDTSFNSSTAANGFVNTILLQPDGKILIGGNFTYYDGVPVNRIARLNADSTLDMTFNSGTGFNALVYTIVRLNDGKLLIGGSFVSYNGSSCKRIVRVNNDGLIDSTFVSSPNSDPDGSVTSLVIQSNGKILLGGLFTNFSGYSRNKIASINADGSLDTGFYPFVASGLGFDDINPIINEIALQSDGKIVIVGLFNSYSGVLSKNIVRLNPNGTIDTTFSTGTGPNNFIRGMAVLPNDKIIIVGEFTTYNGVNKNHVARLNADGTLDTTFSGNTANQTNAVAIQADGKIIVGGSNLVKRMNANGTTDTSFHQPSGPSGGVWTISVLPDNKIIIGGMIGLYDGIQTGSVVRLNSDGTVDTTFNVIDDIFQIFTTSVQADGKIIAGGTFNNFNNTGYNGLIRLNTDGSLDTSFNCTTLQEYCTVHDTKILDDGKIIVGGGFAAFNGFTGRGIMRLNTDGTLDNTFIQGTGFNDGVKALALQGDGKILAVGSFASYNATQVKKIARLHNSSTLSLKNYDKETEIMLYPNPTNDYLKFSISGNANISGFEIFDMTGKWIGSGIQNENLIDVTKYSTGIYFLHVKTDRGVLTCKFIKD